MMCAVDVFLGDLGSSTYFIMRYAYDSSLCMEAPQSNGGQSLLKPCDSQSNSQKFLVKMKSSLTGSVVGYTRQDFRLCGYAASYSWSNAIQCPGLASADIFQFARDATRLRAVQASYNFGCLLASPSTSSVQYGECSSTLASWIIETPGMAPV